MEEVLGQRILQYSLARQIGEGKNGVSWQALDEARQRAVALKLVHPQVAEEDWFIEKALPTLNACIHNDNPALSAVYAVHQLDGCYIIASEYIEGQSLADFVEMAQPDFAQIIKFTRQIACGLEALHKRKLLHGNICMDNIMIDPDGNAILTDAGLGWPLSAFYGTLDPDSPPPAYLSPRIFRGAEPSEADDLYALGAVMFEVVTGQLLQHPASAPAILRNTKAPGELVLLLGKLLSTDPTYNFQSVSDLMITLDAIVDFESEVRILHIPLAVSSSPRTLMAISVLSALLLILWVILSTYYSWAQ